MFYQMSGKIKHSVICLAIFFGWYSCFYLVGLFPGYITLYSTGFAIAFLYNVILLPYAIFSWKYYSRHYTFLVLGRFSIREVWLPALAMIALAFIYACFGVTEKWMIDLRQLSVTSKWLTILTICLTGPIIEEIIFRGFVLNSSIGWGRASKIMGILLTSALFTIIHIQYESIITFIYIFIFSAILCVLRINSRSLLMPMVLHALHNCCTVLALFYLT